MPYIKKAERDKLQPEIKYLLDKLYRRQVVPYEEKKIQENGDVV